MSNESHNKIAFITGSGHRLGRQLAYGFAEQGYDIILHANNSTDAMHEAAEHIRAMGLRAFETSANLANIEEVLALADTVSGITSRLDVLINNAGVFPECAFEDVTPELWDKTQNINTRSMFFLSQRLTPLLQSSKGCVINLASEGAYEVWLKHIPYNVSKAGVVQITRALAKQLAPDVRVNAIAPGLIIIPGEETLDHLSSERIPLKRYGSPIDVIETALFLAEKATYLTGHVLPVDGGMLGAI